jgi:hypothetical protein
MALLTAAPKDLDLEALRGLLQRIDRRAPLGARVAEAAGTLMGRTWEPLGGSAAGPEVFRASLSGFDCVTYLETAFALGLAREPRRFLQQLRRIRYRGGVVSWTRRNHYMTGWIAANARERRLRRVRLPAPGVVRERRLDVVPGLPPRRILLRCLPKRVFWRVRHALRDGDLVCFASTRRNLDVFHTGITVWNGSELFLRHASRSRGRVVEQDLAAFLAENAMAGVIVARPAEGRARRRRLTPGRR